MDMNYWMVERDGPVWLGLGGGELLWSNNPHDSLKFADGRSASLCAMQLLTDGGGWEITEHEDVSPPKAAG